jgi:hypothetical protein
LLFAVLEQPLSTEEARKVLPANIRAPTLLSIFRIDVVGGRICAGTPDLLASALKIAFTSHTGRRCVLYCRHCRNWRERREFWELFSVERDHRF